MARVKTLRTLSCCSRFLGGSRVRPFSVNSHPLHRTNAGRLASIGLQNRTKIQQFPISGLRNVRCCLPGSQFAGRPQSGQRCASTTTLEIEVDPALLEQRPAVESEIKIIDYSADSIVQHDLTSVSLRSFLKEHPKSESAVCRWIYVNGADVGVVKCLGDHKGLHRLAIEDVLDTSRLSKADWYDGHCFMEMTLQRLVHLQDHSNDAAKRPSTKRGSSKPPNAFSSRGRDKWHSFREGKFGMEVEQVSVFLTADNTIITIFEHSGGHVFTPIMTRLESPQTILRSSNDPSMLVHSVIDVIVDLCQPIGKAVSESFSDLEEAVLMNPSLTQSKELYVLRSGLTHLRDNLIATGGLVRVLCDHRAPQETDQPGPGGYAAKVDSPALKSVQMSSTARVYLQDVQDHVQTLSISTNMSIRSAENLTSLIFNTIAASQNESVRQLTLVSSFFLPLTFLTGYFGMNFDPMPVVNNHSDIYFWYIATPIICTMALLLAIRSRARPFRWMQRNRSKK